MLAHTSIGIDEVGRGPLAGPLCVGACLVRKKNSRIFSKLVSGIKDSKKLTATKREQWFSVFTEAAHKGLCSWSAVLVSEKVIDGRGLSFALSYAIRRVLQNLRANPRHSQVLLDGGIKAPSAFLLQRTIIKGDEKKPIIATASIVAKVLRDRHMIRLGKRYPHYGFEKHKGYGTKAHYVALRKYGISEVHRWSFLRRFLIA